VGDRLRRHPSLPRRGDRLPAPPARRRPAARRPIERWLLPLLAVQLAVALAVGLALLVAPSTADELWPWELTPLTSRTVGAWVLALAAGLAGTLLERDCVAFARRR
jgi:hypothetical protein